MRILHLIDNQRVGTPTTTLALAGQSLGRLGDVEQRVLLIGGPSLHTGARRVGINGALMTGCPPGGALLAWPRLRRLMRDEGAFDVVHCWSVGSVALATLAWPGVPRVLTMATPPSQGAVRWARAMMRDGSSKTTILPISSTIRQALLTGGVAESKVHVLRPGIDMGMVRHGERDSLRARWGVDGVECKVIALLSDPGDAADTLRAALALDLADHKPKHVRSNPRLRLLVHPGQRHRLRAHRAAVQMGHVGRLIQEPRISDPWAVLPGCDLALAIGPDAGGLSLIWAMSANLPIIGEATYAVSEIVEDRHSALLVKPDSPKGIARQIRQLIDDQQLAWKLRDTARHEAYSFFSRQTYCESLGLVYEQVTTGQAVRVPELEVTGGLRFAGRG